MGASRILLLVTLISLYGVALFWNSLPAVKESVHLLLDPSVGRLLDYNTDFGIIIITIFIALFMTVIQKYGVDNDTLGKLKKEQKELTLEIKKFKEHPEKMMELQKQALPKSLEMINLSMRPLMFTAIPMLLFIRWIGDYFGNFEQPIKIFGFFSWIWAYFIFTIIFSIIFRKLFKLP